MGVALASLVRIQTWEPPEESQSGVHSAQEHCRRRNEQTRAAQTNTPPSQRRSVEWRENGKMDSI